MKKEEHVPLNKGALADLSIEDLETRLEMACLEIDPCLGSFCWQFISEYACSAECGVHCHPFFGCDPYCYE